MAKFSFNRVPSRKAKVCKAITVLRYTYLSEFEEHSCFSVKNVYNILLCKQQYCFFIIFCEKHKAQHYFQLLLSKLRSHQYYIYRKIENYCRII